jgi:hypothetical protein
MKIGIAAHPLELAVALGLLGLGALAPEEAEASDETATEQSAADDGGEEAEAPEVP